MADEPATTGGDAESASSKDEPPNRWHGYPVGWIAVPPKLARHWIRDGDLRKHDFKKYWEAH